MREYKNTNYITGLRALAIFLVMTIHSKPQESLIINAHAYLNAFFDYGKYGVQIFFVISGFTIFNQLIDRRTSCNKFLLIRFLRLSIVYYPMLLITWYFVSNASIENLFFHLLYLESFSPAYWNSILGVEWTLSVELFYYLILAILLKTGIINNKISKLLFLTFLFVCLAFIYEIKINDFRNIKSFFFLLPYGYLFLLGGVSFHLKKKYLRIINKERTVIISNIALMMSFLAFGTLITFHLNIPQALVGFLTGIITSFIIIFSVDEKNCLSSKPLVIFGSISYSLYLCHSFGFSLAHWTFPNLRIDVPEAFILVKFTFAIFLGIISYYLLENNIYRKVKNFIN